jgi:hypothetical protein
MLNADSGVDMKLIVELAKKLNINVMPISKKEMEEIEDLKLLQSMTAARSEGLADRGETLAKLRSFHSLPHSVG